MADGIIPNAPQFPFDTVYNARMQNSPKYMAGQALGGLGNQLPQIINMLIQKKKEQQQQEMWNRTMSNFSTNPNVPKNAQSLAPLIQAGGPNSLQTMGPELGKLMTPPKPSAEWSVVPGVVGPHGQPEVIDKFTSEVKESGPSGTKSTGYGAVMPGIRKSQYTLQDLPSNQGPNTAGGAAYQVKIGAKQGKALIAKAGSAQRTAIAAADLVRSVTRVAPTDEAMQKANFSGNLITQWSALKQKLTADPSLVYNGKIRKEMYDIFTEMDKSSTPFISNQLDDMADAGFPVTPNTRKRQLGETLPEIPYQDDVPDAGNAGGDFGPAQEARYQELMRKKQSGTIGK